MPKETTITIRIDPKEKERIKRTASCCGLSTTEYIKQRALGYEPRAVPPDALFSLLEKLGELEDKAVSPATDAAICSLLDDITGTLLQPAKEAGKWQSQDSGP